MESWLNGKRQLIQDIEKAYDLIGVNLTAELDEENTARVGREELQALQEQSTRCEELIGENVRLSEELERYNVVAQRVDGLEKDNKRLSVELKQALQKQPPVFSPPIRSSHLFSDTTLTPLPTEPPSVHRIEHDESKTVTKEAYRALVVKHNHVYEQWSGQREARKKYEERLNKVKEKVRSWHKYCDVQDKMIAQKDDHIQRLEEEIQRLRSRSIGGTEKDDSADDRRSPSLAVSEAPRATLRAPSAAPLTGKTGSPEMQVTRKTPIEILRGYTVYSRQGPAQSNGSPEKSNQLPRQLDEEPQLPELSHYTRRIINDSEDDLEPELELLEQLLSGTTEEDIDPVLQEDPHHRDDVKEESMGDQQDTPVVISTRRVKKRKGIHKAEQPSTVSNVKYEILSSSPVGLTRLGYIDSNESIDLDDIGEKVVTPKKQRHLMEFSRGRRAILQDTEDRRSGSQSQDHSYPRAVSEQISKETPIRRVGVARINSALHPLSVNKQILPRTSEDRPPKKRRIASDKAVGELVEDVEISASGGKPKRTSAREVNERLGDLLAQPSPPKLVLSPGHLNISSTIQGRRSGLALHREDLRDLKVESAKGNNARSMVDQSRPSSFLSKTTDYGSTDASRPSTENSTDLQRPSSTHRPPPVTSAHFSTPIPRGSLGGAELVVPASANETYHQSKGTPKQASARKRQSRSGRTVADCEMDPDSESLRTRPVTSLRLEDFKINPNYNQGYNYAFSDVVRNKNERRCLQGCTKPGCCGEKFRALAAFSRDPTKPLTLSQEEADDDLLQEFLGDNVYKLRNMTTREREQVLLQARTRELANRHGRHRHAYERPASPPGFWRADFPTTQEELLDREKAKQFERGQVLQRYEEAMRPGGTFMFRDE